MQQRGDKLIATYSPSSKILFRQPPGQPAGIGDLYPVVKDLYNSVRTGKKIIAVNNRVDTRFWILDTG